MTWPEEREQLRLALLRYLGENPARFGLSSRLLAQLARCDGLNAETIEQELQYLMDKGLVTTVPKAISPENRFFRITAAGCDNLCASA